MAVLTVQAMNRAGLDIDASAVAAAGGGDSFPNTGSEFLYVKNGGAGSITVTLVFGTLSVDGVTPANKTVAVAAGKQLLIGPFPTQWYNDANSRMNLSYSGVVSVTVAAIKPP